MEKSQLRKGMLVAWDGPERPERGLRRGHPGRVWDPSWQDVGVTWAGMDNHALANNSVYDYEDLREIPRRVLKLLRLVLVDHVDEVLREALMLEDPDAVFGPPRTVIEPPIAKTLPSTCSP